MGKARGVNSGVHQSSLGYLFGSSGDSPSSAATKMGTTTTTTTTTTTDGTGRRPITTTTTTVTDNNNRLAAGVRGSPNNYFRSEGQNSGNFLTKCQNVTQERPSTKVRSAPGGVSSLGYLFGGPNAADSCDLLELPAVAQLEKDPKYGPVHQLLKIFLTQRLNAYREFQTANSECLQSYDISSVRGESDQPQGADLTSMTEDFNFYQGGRFPGDWGSCQSLEMVNLGQNFFKGVYQKSVSAGHRRNFSSSSTKCEVSKKTAMGIYVVTRTLGFASGFLAGNYVVGDFDKKLLERLEEDMRKDEEYFKRSEAILSHLSKLPRSAN
ncbi:hypothetical protein HID58_044788 [Brassica napus]|uniref:Uncharacterized protein n=1 Tax=Brassica napus TaxID=3708 RepID=A0ABQ8BKE0_BRANA|nr:hypothetical protein HID58_044788 [Brassica napus]